MASCVRDSAGGALVLKLVNGAASPKPVRVELAGAKKLPSLAELTVLAGPDADAVNDYDHPRTVTPRASRISISPAFDYEAPAHSLTILRIAP